ncbi:MAG: hypothetical protein ACTSRU_18620, partial [Candidatus Hodarchaeales archaeon]
MLKKTKSFILLFMIIMLPTITDMVVSDFSEKISISKSEHNSMKDKENIAISNGYSTTEITHTSEDKNREDSYQDDGSLELGNIIQQPRFDINDVEPGLQQLLQSSVSEFMPIIFEDDDNGRIWIGYTNFTGSDWWGTSDSDLYGKYTDNGGSTWSDP